MKTTGALVVIEGHSHPDHDGSRLLAAEGGPDLHRGTVKALSVNPVTLDIVGGLDSEELLILPDDRSVRLTETPYRETLPWTIS